MIKRGRRLRVNNEIRDLVRENTLSASDFIYPLLYNSLSLYIFQFLWFIFILSYTLYSVRLIPLDSKYSEQ